MTEPDSDSPQPGKAETEDLTGRSRRFVNLVASWGSFLVLFVVGFVMPRTIDHFIGQAALGVWDFGWALVNYISLAGLGMGTSVGRFVAAHRAAGDTRRLSQTVSSVVVIQLLIAAVIVAVTLLIGWRLPEFFSAPDDIGNDAVRAVVILLGLSLAVQMLFDPFRGIMTGCHRWDTHNAILAGSRVLIAGLMVVVMFFGGGLTAIAWTYFVVTLAAELVRMRVALRLCPEARIARRHANLETARELFGFGLKTIIASLAPIIIIQSTNLMVGSMLGAATLAVFARPLALMRHTETFLTRYHFLLTPTVGSLQSTGRNDEIVDELLTASRYSVAMALPVSIGLAVFGDLVIGAWMGPAYVDWPLMIAFAALYWLPISQGPSMRILMGLNQHGVAGVLSLVTALAIYAVCVLVVLIYGLTLTGAAVMVVLPMLVANGIVVPIYTCKMLSVGYREYAVGVFLRPVLANLLFLAMLVAGRQLDSSIGLVDFILINGVSGLALAVMYFYLVLEPDTRQRMAGRLVAAGKAMRVNLGGVRAILLHVVARLGPLHLWRYRNRYQVPVLMFHGVYRPRANSDWRPMRPRVSETDLEFLLREIKRNYEVISLTEAGEMLAGKRAMKARTCVLTFDDGYQDFIDVAYPILQRMRLPATVFVATGAASSGCPHWFDRLDFFYQHARVSEEQRRRAVVSDVHEDALRQRFIADLRGLVQHGPDDLVGRTHAESAIAELEAKSSLRPADDDPWIAVASWQELRGLDSGLIEVGSHTVDHYRLTAIPTAELSHQLSDSKQRIETEIGRPCTVFCYPYGDIDDKVRQQVAATGYHFAVTCEPGLNAAGSAPCGIRRIGVPEDKEPYAVLAAMSGFTYDIARVRRRLRRWLSSGHPPDATATEAS